MRDDSAEIRDHFSEYRSCFLRVCVACNAVITVKHILTECADLLEIRKKYFEDRFLYSLFRNVIPEIIFDFFCERLVCFTKYEVC